jgi:hypothetical protein
MLTSPLRPEAGDFSLIGQGYEHFVYRRPARRLSVLKISGHKVRELLTEFDGPTRPGGTDLASYARSRFGPDVLSKNDDLRALLGAFGAAHVLRERRYLVLVELSDRFIRQLFLADFWGRLAPPWVGNSELVWTHAALQPFSQSASDPRRLSISFGRFTEDRPFDREVYRAFNLSLERGHQGVVQRDMFLELQDHTAGNGIGKLLGRADRDPELRAAVADFVVKAVCYAKTTGKILALAGQDNGFFVREAGRWTYQLMDVLPIPTGALLSEAEQFALGISDWPRPKKELETIKRALNFVRTIDGLAAAVGVDERIGLSPALIAASELDLAPDGRYAF